MTKEPRYRFAFDISEEQQKRVFRLMSTYGLRKAVFSTILDDLLDLIEENGEDVIYFIIKKSVKAKEILPCLEGTKNGNIE